MTVGEDWVGTGKPLIEVRYDPMGSGSCDPERRLKAEYILTVLLGSEPGSQEVADSSSDLTRGPRGGGSRHPAAFSGRTLLGPYQGMESKAEVGASQCLVPVVT